MSSRAEMRKRNGYRHSSDRLLNAIVQDIENGIRAGRYYHNIPDNEGKRTEFEGFARKKFPNAFMVIYYKQNREEHSRVKLT